MAGTDTLSQASPRVAGPTQATLLAALRRNGLSLVILALFALFLVGQSITGHHEYNQEQQDHGGLPVSYGEYLRTGHFLESTAENWESEFLQMFAFLLLTAFLYQKGSAESKKLEEPEPAERDPRQSRRAKDVPWPVRRGGWALRLYEHSLSIVFFALFVVSLTLHAVGGAAEYSQEQIEHGSVPVSALQYVATSRFWFESFQNWQSEFLALAGMVVLSIFLRERGSPQSKPVDAPHGETGNG